MTQTPTVGRIVHYQSYGTPGGEYLPEARAAVITEISADQQSTDVGFRVGLCVLNPTGQFFNRNVPFAEEPTPGHWNWPPRVDTVEVRTGDGTVHATLPNTTYRG